MIDTLTTVREADLTDDAGTKWWVRLRCAGRGRCPHDDQVLFSREVGDGEDVMFALQEPQLRALISWPPGEPVHAASS